MTRSIKQMTELYGVGQHTVLAWIRSGELQAVNCARNPGGKPHWRITDEAIRTFELLRSAQPVEPRSWRRKKQPADVVTFY